MKVLMSCLLLCCCSLSVFAQDCEPTDLYFYYETAVGTSQCWTLCPGVQRKIYSYNTPDYYRPEISVQAGCNTNSCETDCTPASEWYFATDWYYMDNHWCRDLVGNGCVCVTVDAYQYICEPGDVYFDGNAPAPQYQCWRLCEGTQRKIYVIPGIESREPVVSVSYGCSPFNTGCSVDCTPASYFEFTTGWYFMDNHWCRDMIGDGCVCVTLEGYLGDCVPVDTYFDGNAPLPQYNCWTLCWPNVRKIYVIPGQEDRQPIVSISYGCSPNNTNCDDNCVPATFWEYTSDWYFMDDHWCRDLTASGCICVCLEGFLAVELQSFAAIAGDNRVDLNWSTASEAEHDRFEILRDDVRIAAIPAAGSQSGHSYHYADVSAQNGRSYAYTLEAVDVSGHRAVLASETVTPRADLAVAGEFALQQNYPNPFNPTTEIRFTLDAAAPTKLVVYDLLGKEVVTLVNGELAAGAHSVAFNGAALPSGVYVYRLESGYQTAVRKMALMK